MFFCHRLAEILNVLTKLTFWWASKRNHGKGTVDGKLGGHHTKQKSVVDVISIALWAGSKKQKE